MITREKILNELNDIYKMNKTKNPGIAIKSLEQMSKLLGLDLVDKFGSRATGGDSMNIQINYVTPQNNNNDNTNIIPLE
jgi:hypothetical protein